MSKKILFLTTAHYYNDERIFYHQALELKRRGFEIKISSLSSEFVGVKDGIEVESYSILEKSVTEKIDVFIKIGSAFKPNSIICSEPLAVVAAHKIAKTSDCSIIYDVTEWYPSKRMLQPYSFPKKYFIAIQTFIFQLYAGFLSNYFIFGEKTKMFPLIFFNPFKKKLLLSYYPSKKYIHTEIKSLKRNEINLCYTGVFSKEKGIENFLNVAFDVKRKRPQAKVKLLLIGYTRTTEEKKFFENLLYKYNFEDIEIKTSVPFEEFSKSFAQAHICMDLREINYENDHCLPIKIFYYSASGKPVIYSNLKATRKYVNVDKFGYLVDPENHETIADIVISYMDNPNLYNQHAQNGRELFDKYYNWEKISQSFVDFVKNTDK